MHNLSPTTDSDVTIRPPVVVGLSTLLVNGGSLGAATLMEHSNSQRDKQLEATAKLWVKVGCRWGRIESRVSAKTDEVVEGSMEPAEYEVRYGSMSAGQVAAERTDLGVGQVRIGRQGAGVVGSEWVPKAEPGSGARSKDVLGRAAVVSSSRLMARPGELDGPEQHEFCRVTLIYQSRLLDLTLPADVPFAELQPMLVRLLSPDPANTRTRVDEPVDECNSPASADRIDGVPELVQWQFSTIGGVPIGAGETLSATGVYDGDVVELRPMTAPRPVQRNGSARDRFEDVVTAHDRFWTSQTSATFVQWAVVFVAAGLIIPLIRLPLGFGTVGLAATVAVALSVLAAVLAGRSAPGCAAAMLAISCGWACSAGTSAFLALVSAPAQPAKSMASLMAEWLGGSGAASGWPVLPAIAVGALAALLTAATSAHHQAAALVHTTALVAIAGSLVALTAAVLIGMPAVDAGKAIAVFAVLALGGLPRAALLAGGMAETNVGDRPGALEVGFARSDRVLIGSIVGVSLVAASAACSAAFAEDLPMRFFAAAVGAALLLRSRIFSQIPHAVGPRIAGVLVFVALWVAAYRDAAPPGTALLLVVATSAIATAMVLAGRAPAQSPIGRARLSRLLGITEQLLVVLMVVLAAGTSGLFGWIARAVG